MKSYKVLFTLGCVVIALIAGMIIGTALPEKTVDFNISSQKNTKDVAKVIQQTCKTITASGLLDENLQGYNNSNIKEIKIRYNVNIQL